MKKFLMYNHEPMDIKEILEPISKELQKVEEIIIKNLENKISLIPKIGKHIFESGGKRLRPTLTLLSCKHYNYNHEIKYELAAAIEYIHTATLLHDDVVDNSDLRRGRETANVLWGNQAPVLVGDYLFAKAFIMMVKSNNIEILELLSNVTGLLAQGEIFELVKTGDLTISEKDYFEIIEEKTGVLISAAAQIGPILAKASIKEVEKFKNYGINIGIAFQLIDDALDYISTDEKFGKKIGIDIREGKVTLPLIIALRNTKDKERLKDLFFKEELKESDIDEIRKIVIENNGVNATIDTAKMYVEKAKESINDIKDSDAKKILIDLADFIVSRRY